jgi:hypothetical protein
MREPTGESGVVILPVSGETDTNFLMGRDLDRFLEETRAEEARIEQEKQQRISQFFWLLQRQLTLLGQSTDTIMSKIIYFGITFYKNT